MRNRGFTLIELLLAIAVTGLLAVMVGALTSAVSSGGQYVQASQQTAQHALAVMDYIRRQVAAVYATAAEPGVMVVRTEAAGWQFPETLVLWLPAGGKPANPGGLPLVEELLLICPDPEVPNRLIQVRAVGDQRTVSLWDLDTPNWRAELDQIKRSANSQRMVLTERVRVVALSQQDDQPPAPNGMMNQIGPQATPPANSPAGTSGQQVLPGGGMFSAPSQGDRRQAGVLFSLRLAPTQQELEAVAAGTLAWDQVAWPQGIYSASTGLRQVWVSWELQLSTQSSGQPQEVVLPFFGSATRYYQVNRDEL